MKRLMKHVGLLVALMFWMGGFTFAGSDLRTVADSFPDRIQEETTWAFAIDLGDVTERSEADIEADIREFLDTHLSTVPAELNCKVSVTGKVSVGVASINITVEVSGPCSKVRSQGKAIAKQVLSE